jgi:hypothetical protein
MRCLSHWEHLNLNWPCIILVFFIKLSIIFMDFLMFVIDLSTLFVLPSYPLFSVCGCIDKIVYAISSFTHLV